MNRVTQSEFSEPVYPVTRIGFTLPQDVQMTLSVFYALGQEVITLVNGVQETGVQEIG